MHLETTWQLRSSTVAKAQLRIMRRKRRRERKRNTMMKKIIMRRKKKKMRRKVRGEVAM